jgi:hypothetical protein
MCAIVLGLFALQRQQFLRTRTTAHVNEKFLSAIVKKTTCCLYASDSQKKITLARAQDRAACVFDCRTANDPATINKKKTNENNTDVDRWADARRLRINGKPCS